MPCWLRFNIILDFVTADDLKASRNTGHHRVHLAKLMNQSLNTGICLWCTRSASSHYMRMELVSRELRSTWVCPLGVQCAGVCCLVHNCQASMLLICGSSGIVVDGEVECTCTCSRRRIRLWTAQATTRLKKTRSIQPDLDHNFKVSWALHIPVTRLETISLSLRQGRTKSLILLIGDASLMLKPSSNEKHWSAMSDRIRAADSYQNLQADCTIQLECTVLSWGHWLLPGRQHCCELCWDSPELQAQERHGLMSTLRESAT